MSPARARSVPLLLLGLVAGAACRGAGDAPARPAAERATAERATAERPAAALHSFEAASDARLDPDGRILGSFVGEGTPSRFHLLSSDTALIARLARRYRPDLVRPGADVWASLARESLVTVTPAAPAAGPVPAGSATGRGELEVRAILLRGSRCGTRGAQAEIVVEPRGPGERLQGPIVAAFLGPGDRRLGDEPGEAVRQPPPPPPGSLVRDLLARTRRAVDSSLSARYLPRELPVALTPPERLEVNTLADVDAADVIAFRTDSGRADYAVALRERRAAAGGAAADTLVAATLMLWDGTGARQRTVFHPTVLALRRGRPGPGPDGWPPFWWRRVAALSAIGHPGDYLWMEQVDARTGSVLWGVLDPRGNAVVAAAEVRHPCP